MDAQARALQQLDEEIRLYEAGHTAAIRETEMTGDLEVRRDALLEFESADDVSVSALRRYLDDFGARLELVAVFEDEELRAPIELSDSCVR